MLNLIFAGNYTSETCEDPNSVKSRTWCVIKYAGYSITWLSCLQTEISWSKVEVEYVVILTAARDILPLRSIVIELNPILKILTVELVMKYTLFEDNKGAEELTNVTKNRPRTKHIAVKYHHFHEAVRKNAI